jgi:hypothetical protein
MSLKISKFDGFCKRYVADTGLTDFRGDAVATSVFFTRQLEDIDAQLNDTKYAQLKSLEMVQLKPGLDPLAERFTPVARLVRREVEAVREPHGHRSARADLPQGRVCRLLRLQAGLRVQPRRAREVGQVRRALDRERAEAARQLLAQSLDALSRPATPRSACPACSP